MRTTQMNGQVSIMDFTGDLKANYLYMTIYHELIVDTMIEFD